MNFSRRIYYSFALILICSTIISIAGISAFQRLEPFIDTLNSANTQSIYYAEQMLLSISAKKDLKIFENNLEKAKKNITEVGEKDVLDQITQIYPPAFKGNKKIEDETISKIAEFSKINRVAMERAGITAEKTERVGIWIILFPSIFIWIMGIALLKRMEKIFIKPIEELNSVIYEYNKGNHMRRCPTVTISKDLQKLYDGINKILDNR